MKTKFNKNNQYQKSEVINLITEKEIDGDDIIDIVETSGLIYFITKNNTYSFKPTTDNTLVFVG